MKKTVSEEVLEELREHFDSKSVTVVEGGTQYARTLNASFPFSGSKISWANVPHSITRIASHEEYTQNCLDFMETVLTNQNISRSTVVAIVSDSLLEFELVVTVSNLRPVLQKILDVPQHTYVVELKANWCMAFTMEGDMAFGYRP